MTTERRKRASREWHAKHPGYQKEWRKANPEYAAKSSREWHARHPGRSAIQGRRWRAKYPDYQTHYKRLWAYGLSKEKFLEMLDNQKGCCAICSKKFGKGKDLGPHVDHCHRTGKIRGLLCNPCNRGLGLLGDTLLCAMRTVSYLRRTL
jgi:hypothetical protein